MIEEISGAVRCCAKQCGYKYAGVHGNHFYLIVGYRN